MGLADWVDRVMLIFLAFVEHFVGEVLASINSPGMCFNLLYPRLQQQI